MKPWVAYTLIRLGVFAVALTVLLLVGVPAVYATIIAAVLGFCVGYIFFGRLRTAMATELLERRATGPGRKDADAAAEDAEIER